MTADHTAVGADRADRSAQLLAAMAGVREDFPLLERSVRDGKPLVYLDSGATAQKPQVVIDAEVDFYENHNAAVHRGAHYLAEQATIAYERAREQVAALVGTHTEEIVWTRNATDGLNLLAYAFSNASLGRGGASARRFELRAGDEIVVTEAEHHSNLIPWQELAARTGATLRWIELDDDGQLRLEQLQSVVTTRTKVLAFTHVSNVTGAITDVAAFVARAREVDAITVLDACQSVPHLPVNFPELGVDFAVFSAHKIYGPSGIGALYGRAELLRDLPAVYFGGSMVEVVTMSEATYSPAPLKFEAGTQAVAQAIAFGAAAQYLSDLGMETVAEHERVLTESLLDAVRSVPGVQLIGPDDADKRVGVAAFTVAGVHSHDVGQVLDDAGIAVRVGHHCAQPLHRRFGIAATARASLGIYSTAADVARFAEELAKVRPYFGLE